MTCMKTILSLLFFLAPALAAAFDLPQNAPVPGGVAVVALEDVPAGTPPEVRYEDRPVLVVRREGAWLALVGVSLDAKTGRHAIEVRQSGAQPRTQHFAVVDKRYEEQRLTVKNQRMVDPNPDDLERIARERRITLDTIATWSDTLPDLRLSLPVEGRLSSSFGLRRFFNDQPRRPHSGIDLAAPTGTPILAAADGRVVTTGDFFFSGNIVYVDHGSGLMTMYAHLDRIDVAPGQVVRRGEPLGTVGMTGRVTGPHLHWTVYLNRYAVDPSLFIGDALALRE